MSERNPKFKVGDVVYIPEMGGGTPSISEETIRNVFRDCRGNNTGYKYPLYNVDYCFQNIDNLTVEMIYENTLKKY